MRTASCFSTVCNFAFFQRAPVTLRLRLKPLIVMYAQWVTHLSYAVMVVHIRRDISLKKCLHLEKSEIFKAWER